jgi:hypothetical protein
VTDWLEAELERYAAFRRRLGEAFDFGDALLGHREQCLVNLLDDEDDGWVQRVRHLDEIAQRREVWLGEARPLRAVLDELSERERRRRAQRVREHRSGAGS